MNQIPRSSPYLSPEEKKMLMTHSNWRAAGEIAIHYGWIAGALLLPWIWTTPITVIISLMILGGQQLACAVLLHDAGHYAVFKDKRLNDFVGQWLGAYPVFQNMKAYRNYHLLHHQLTGLPEDPDILLTRGYPASRASMIRKLLRDLTGLTGLKSIFGLFMMHLGLLEYNLGKKRLEFVREAFSFGKITQSALRNLSGPIIVNVIMAFLISWLLAPWIYLLWIGAYLTTFQFCIRIRSIAEHSLLDEPTNPVKNTRTTHANWFERLLFAPYHVNYHLEHHMLMTVPSYNLPKMHQLLLERGFYEEGILETGYLDVLRKTITS